MNRRILILPLFFVLCSGGCAITTEEVKKSHTMYQTKLNFLFLRNFEGFDAPEITEIKAEGRSRDYPYATFDDVWDSIIMVLMQERIFVWLSKGSGVIVAATPPEIALAEESENRISIHADAPPSAIFVERGEVVTVYLSWMEDFFREEYKPEEFNKHFKGFAKYDPEYVKFTPEDKDRMSKDFFDKIATQVYASKKWKYLYKN